MLIVGLTGGIGSGKTLVSDYFKSLDIVVVDADVVSRQVVEPGTEALGKIAEKFDKDILNSDGTLNRRVLRNIIFNNPNEKQWLENLLHPLIGLETARQLQNSQSAYTVFVSPLLIEIGQYKMTNRILVVDAPENLQVSRTVERDDTQAENVQAIMDTQATRQRRLEMADDVILNDSDINSLHKKIDDLHNLYLKLSLE